MKESTQKRMDNENFLETLEDKKVMLLAKQEELNHKQKSYEKERTEKEDEMDRLVDQGVATYAEFDLQKPFVTIEGRKYTSLEAISRLVDQTSKSIKTMLDRVDHYKKRENPWKHQLEQLLAEKKELDTAREQTGELFPETVVCQGKEYRLEDLLKKEKERALSIRFLQDYQKWQAENKKH